LLEGSRTSITFLWHFNATELTFFLSRAHAVTAELTQIHWIALLAMGDEHRMLALVGFTVACQLEIDVAHRTSYADGTTWLTYFPTNRNAPIVGTRKTLAALTELTRLAVFSSLLAKTVLLIAEQSVSASDVAAT